MMGKRLVIVQALVIIGNLLILCGLFALLSIIHAERGFSGTWISFTVYLCVAYGVSLIGCNPLAYTFQRFLVFILATLLTASLAGVTLYSPWFFTGYFLTAAIGMFLFRRAVCRWLKEYHRQNPNQVLYVGSCRAIKALYYKMKASPIGRYQVLGYFDKQPNCYFPALCHYLGTPDQLIQYISSHPVSGLYYSGEMDASLHPVMNYCKEQAIPCYGIPSAYSQTTDCLEVDLKEGDAPQYRIKPSPLTLPVNRTLKRLFDILFSGAILCLIFPWVYLIVAIDMLSHGQRPVIIRKRFVGKDGKEFDCFRFKQTPRWNAIQAFPSFINVLLGQMAIVGPKPHTLAEAEQYGQYIRKSEKHYDLSPGITGWAQINGYLGTAEKLKDMEGNIKADLWYLENGNAAVDLYIIVQTICQIFHLQPEETSQNNKQI